MNNGNPKVENYMEPAVRMIQETYKIMTGSIIKIKLVEAKVPANGEINKIRAAVSRVLNTIVIQYPFNDIPRDNADARAALDNKIEEQIAHELAHIYLHMPFENKEDSDMDTYSPKAPEKDIIENQAEEYAKFILKMLEGIHGKSNKGKVR